MLKDIITKQAERGNYFILAANNKKVSKGWKEVPIKFISEDRLDGQINRFFKDYPMSTYDLYFCPVVYQGSRRRKAEVCDIKFLWQDIDEMADINKLPIKPTYLWESSPNKWQGLWELDRYITGTEAELINKALSEKVGADKCHDIGHVIRIPGTINHKYKNKPKVGKEIYSKEIYRYPALKKDLLGDKKKKEHKTSGGSKSAFELIEKYNLVDGRIGELLTAKDTKGYDRSEEIWFLENSLYEKGIPLDDIITLIKASVWNKWSSMSDGGDSRLRKEILKIIEKKQEEGGTLARYKKKTKGLVLTDYQKLMSSEQMMGGWLVKGFWGRRSHGIVAGQPKVFKSTYVQDLAVSVASGQPFLGRYEVEDPGPVIIIQNENNPHMIADRTKKIICNRKGLVGKATIKNSNVVRVKWPKDIPLYTVDQQGFMLDNEEHQQQIEAMIAQIKPTLVIFDPLYLMFAGSMNKAEELQPVLNWLTEVKLKYKTAVLLVHHYNKGSTDERGGQKMLGSVVLHGWVASAWYMKRKPKTMTDIIMQNGRALDAQVKEPTHVIMEREFREAGNFPTLDLALTMGEVGEIDYNVEVEEYKEEEQSTNKADDNQKKEMALEHIKGLLKQATYPLNKKELLTQFYDTFNGRVSKRIITEVVDMLDKESDVEFIKGKGWTIKV